MTLFRRTYTKNDLSLSDLIMCYRNRLFICLENKLFIETWSKRISTTISNNQKKYDKKKE